MTSIGGVPLDYDEIGVDAAFSGTQKCLSVPPGLAPVTFSKRALERVHARTHPVPFYFDTKLLNGYFGTERAYHYTAPISMIYALVASLEDCRRATRDIVKCRRRSVAVSSRSGSSRSCRSIRPRRC